MMPTRQVVIPLLAVFLVEMANVDALRAQEAPERPRTFMSLERLEEYYNEQAATLDRHRIEDLAALATRKDGPEADTIYRKLFQLAIHQDLASAARPAARTYLSAGSGARDVRALATLIAIVAEADGGQPGPALEDLRTFVKTPSRAADRPGAESRDSVLGVGEAFVHRLIRSRRYELARKACSLIAQETRDPDIAAHFASRLRPLRLVGEKAPPLEGIDADGRRLQLADFQGKVVLIVFWATWCPPCLDVMPRLNALAARYERQGLTIVGVNVDAHHEDIKDIKSALPIVRHALIHYGVTWPSVLNGEDAVDIAKAYGVTSIPSNFLIGRDGTILSFELSDPELEAAVANALGTRAGKTAVDSPGTKLNSSGPASPGFSPARR